MSVPTGETFWHLRGRDFFVDIADDGFVVASSCAEADEVEVSKVKASGSCGEWHLCALTDCLEECVAAGCSCSRAINPAARDGFLRAVVEQLSELAAGKSEVCYASLGSGLLRFDFSLLELLLASGVPVTAVHLVDSQYEADAKGYARHRVSLAQFASWFSARGVDVYAHRSLERFTFEARRTEALPLAVLQVDCTELTAVFESEVKPALEEVLSYGGFYCALTAREGASGAGALGSNNAWGEFWRLVPESGRLKMASLLRFRPGELSGTQVSLDEPLPHAVVH
eukprot:TRINITY_DN42872_c0_g1_i1.p1 TRINITY_DN42872_c0_g1~~TRINITY_DN42872_c0_g1_i1.p1  ORF type:complete len:296 (+),score=55.36 TRINITY_DN42872_c0_g1_i1:38-889(+)